MLRRIMTAALAAAILALTPLAALAEDSALDGLLARLRGGSGEGLWSGIVESEFITVDAPGLGKDDRLAGISRDGRRVLIIAQGGPTRLIDLESGETLPLAPADWLLPRIREIIERFTQAPCEAADDDLMEAYAASINPGTDRYYWFNPSYVAQGEDNTLWTVDRGGGQWTIDCDTGRVYGPFNGWMSVHEGRGVCMKESNEASIFDLGTGAETPFALDGGDAFDDGVTLRTARFLSDGRIVALVRDAKLDPKAGQPSALAVVETDGSARYIPLGMHFFGKDPDSILLLSDRWAIVYGRSVAMATPSLAVDLETGAVTALYSQQGLSGVSLRNVPLEECLDENGWPSIPQGGAGLVPLAGMADGETLLVQLFADGQLTVYRPATGESRTLSTPDGTPMSVPIMNGFSTDGVDRFVTFFMGDAILENPLQYVRLISH